MCSADYTTTHNKDHIMPQVAILSIREYTAMRALNIDMYMFERFWSTSYDGLPILICAEMLEWLGYTHPKALSKKQAFLQSLSRINALKNVDYVNYCEYGYREFRDAASNWTPNVSSLYPITPQETNFYLGYILLTPKCFRNIIFHINTPKQLIVTRHIANIEAISIQYRNYVLGELRLQVAIDAPETSSEYTNSESPDNIHCNTGTLPSAVDSTTYSGLLVDLSIDIIETVNSCCLLLEQ